MSPIRRAPITAALVLLASGVSATAQTARFQQQPAAPAPAVAAPAASTPPPIRRWLEFQALTLMTRYRFIETSAGVVTSNQWQHKEVIRGRFNIDRSHRYTINAGVFTGANFISTWNNTGVGTGAPAQFVGTLFLKQLYGSAIPVQGLEVQYGGLYVARGDSTEFTTYDEDGFIVGERVSVRRPKELFFDELSATRGLVGPYNSPSLTTRWDGLHEANYRQVLVAKRIGPRVRTSGDYTYDNGADTLHGAIALAFKPGAAISAIRYEQYWRVTSGPAAGFAITAERPIGKRFRLQAGYTTVDQLYGGWNADRIQRGRRVFAIGTLPLTDELTVSIFATEALGNAYSITNRTRTDLVLSYDLLRTLQKARVF